MTVKSDQPDKLYFTPEMTEMVTALATARTTRWKYERKASKDQVMGLHPSNVRGAFGELYIAYLLKWDWRDFIQSELAIANDYKRRGYVGSADFTIDHGPGWDRTAIDVKTSKYLLSGALPSLAVKRAYATPGRFHAYVGVAVDGAHKYAGYSGWCTDAEVFSDRADAFARKCFGDDISYLVPRDMLRTDLDWITTPLGVRLHDQTG